MRANKRIERAKRLTAVSEMADNSLTAGIIDNEQHAEIKGKVRELELDNIFKAMVDYCRK